MNRKELRKFVGLDKDLIEASKDLSKDEARFLVDAYYTIQDNRIRAGNQKRALEELKEPHETLIWLFNLNDLMEAQIKRALNRYSLSTEIGQWAQGIYGIGPVLSAGLIAHIDMNRAPTVGHIWTYAGINGTQVWLSREKTKALVEKVIKSKGGKPNMDVAREVAIQLFRNPVTFCEHAKNDKGKYTKASITEAAKRRHWNATLKTLCWKIGQSFMKFSNHEECYYGHIYRDRKALETSRNEQGMFKEAAAEILRTKNFGKTTDAYKHLSSGHLPPAQIDARARRYAVKIFISHWHHMAYRAEFNKEPPKPFMMEIKGHPHYIAPPE